MVEKQHLGKLEDIVVESLKELGGKSHFIPICKWVWKNHEKWIRCSGDMFYIWHYEIRWAATRLRKKGLLAPARRPRDGIWELYERSHKPTHNI